VKSGSRPPGRPRNPEIDLRVRDAAKTVYAEVGWADFSFDLVARRAGVGRSAIYRRWASREDLLIDAVSTLDVRPFLREQPSLRAAVEWLVRHELTTWSLVTFRAYNQLAIDRGSHPILSRLYTDRVVTPLIDGLREVVSRAVAAGEVPDGVSAVLLIECLVGAVSARMYATDTHQNETPALRSLKNPDRYVGQLVAFLMAGVAASASEPPV
jgi:AcrR family transcriptional regulator